MEIPAELWEIMLKELDLFSRFVCKHVCKMWYKLCRYALCNLPTINLVREGDLHMIKWFISYGYSWPERRNEYEFAIENGNAEMAAWLISQNRMWNETSYYNHIENRDNERIIWLAEMGCPFNATCMTYAANRGNRIDQLSVMKKLGVPIDHDAVIAAICKHNEITLEWLLANGAPIEENAIEIVMCRANPGIYLHVFRKLIESGNPFNRALAIARINKMIPDDSRQAWLNIINQN